MTTLSRASITPGDSGFKYLEKTSKVAFLKPLVMPKYEVNNINSEHTLPRINVFLTCSVNKLFRLRILKILLNGAQ